MFQLLLLAFLVYQIIEKQFSLCQLAFSISGYRQSVLHQIQTSVITKITLFSLSLKSSHVNLFFIIELLDSWSLGLLLENLLSMFFCSLLFHLTFLWLIFCCFLYSSLTLFVELQPIIFFSIILTKLFDFIPPPRVFSAFIITRQFFWNFIFFAAKSSWLFPLLFFFGLLIFAVEPIAELLRLFSQFILIFYVELVLVSLILQLFDLLITVVFSQPRVSFTLLLWLPQFFLPPVLFFFELTFIFLKQLPLFGLLIIAVFSPFIPQPQLTRFSLPQDLFFFESPLFFLHLFCFPLLFLPITTIFFFYLQLFFFKYPPLLFVQLFSDVFILLLLQFQQVFWLLLLLMTEFLKQLSPILAYCDSKTSNLFWSLFHLDFLQDYFVFSEFFENLIVF